MEFLMNLFKYLEKRYKIKSMLEADIIKNSEVNWQG